MQFMHISDLHFKGDYKDNVSARALLDYIRFNYPDHYLIITGDITDDGSMDEYEQAYDALKPFLGRIFICPGNHDFGVEGNFYSSSRAKRFDAMLGGPLEQGGTFFGDNTPVVNFLSDGQEMVMLIALDTNLETKVVHDFACGMVGARQLSFLNMVLPDPAYAHQTKILFLHHHPYFHSDPFLRLLDAEDLLRAIRGQVEVMCFGHRHKAGLWANREGIRYSLAADKAPDSDRFREISMVQKNITVKDIVWR